LPNLRNATRDGLNLFRGGTAILPTLDDDYAGGQHDDGAIYCGQRLHTCSNFGGLAARLPVGDPIGDECAATAEGRESYRWRFAACNGDFKPNLQF
jgi:hypothetical protein